MNDAWIVPVATIAAALITTLGLLIARVVRGPVAVTDLWAENRRLREDFDRLNERVQTLIAAHEDQLTTNRIMGEGFDALSNYVERTATATKVRPTYTESEAQAIERARALREDPADSILN